LKSIISDSIKKRVIFEKKDKKGKYYEIKDKSTKIRTILIPRGHVATLFRPEY
jgi:hypothetical protein